MFLRYSQSFLLTSHWCVFKSFKMVWGIAEPKASPQYCKQGHLQQLPSAEADAGSTPSICLHGQDPGVTAVMYVPLPTMADHQHLKHHAQQLTMSSVQVSQGAYNHYVRSAGHNMLRAVSLQVQRVLCQQITHNGCCTCPHLLISRMILVTVTEGQERTSWRRWSGRAAADCSGRSPLPC